MKSRDFAAMKLTTTPEPVRSGRNPAFYPILVLRPERYAGIGEVLRQYPAGSQVREPLDRHKHPIPGIYDIMPDAGRKRLARYRWHDAFGWLEEISPVWTVNGDYPTVLAVSQISDLEDQGVLNIATVMRFGAQLAAMLLGNADSAVRADILDVLAKITMRSQDVADRVEIFDDQIVLTL